MRLAVVVVVNDERPEEVFSGRNIFDSVTILFSGGDGEVAECFFLLVSKTEGLRHHRRRSAGVVTVGNPRGIEDVGGVCQSSTVDVEGKICYS